MIKLKQADIRIGDNKNMNDVSYKKLFKLLIDKGINKTEFAKLCGITPPTLAKLSKNEFISMANLVKICRGLDCQLSDIIEILPNEGDE